MPASSDQPLDGSPSLAPRVLLIVSEPQTADEIAGLLEGSGYEVAVASEWTYALLLALSFEPQLVILDTALPGLSSHSATNILRSAPNYGTKFRSVPFLYLADRDHIVTQRFDHHPDLPTAEYVFKPVDAELLLDRVRRSLLQHRAPNPG